MNVLDVISKAQELLAGDPANGPGWTGPEHVLGYCKRKGGVDALGLPMPLEVCHWDDEMVLQYTVEGALRAASRDDMVLIQVAWDELRAVVAPSRAAERIVPTPTTIEAFQVWRAVVTAAAKQQDLEEWLQQPTRTLQHVLRAFDVVKLKFQKGGDA